MPDKKPPRGAKGAQNVRGDSPQNAGGGSPPARPADPVEAALDDLQYLYDWLQSWNTVATFLGVSRSTITRWKNRTIEPDLLSQRLIYFARIAAEERGVPIPVLPSRAPKPKKRPPKKK